MRCAMIKLALLGLGRMGKEVLNLSYQDNQFKVLFAIDKSPGLNQSSIPVILPEEIEKALVTYQPDIVIDFSHPNATLELAPIILENNVSMVVCTTGFSLEQQLYLKSLAENSQAALLLAPNITMGINLIMLFSKIASEVLDDYNIQIIDYHGKKKKDRPSGTALKIARELENSGKDIDVYGVRVGEIVGIHKILFAGQDDQFELTHQSYAPKTFAKSALKAATLLYGKKGYYEMFDILGLRGIYNYFKTDQ